MLELRPAVTPILRRATRRHLSPPARSQVLALVYIDRLIQRNALLLTSLNVHRIIITAVMLAAKFFDDRECAHERVWWVLCACPARHDDCPAAPPRPRAEYFNNAYYAKVGGVPLVEVNALELEFLFSINFSLHTPTDVFEKYYAELGARERAAARALLRPPPAMSLLHVPACHLLPLPSPSCRQPPRRGHAARADGERHVLVLDACGGHCLPAG